jgi:hypothetical protein
MSLRQKADLRDRFIAIGVNKNLAADLASTVSRYVRDNGPSWTIKRLKLLKTSFLKHIAGESYAMPFVASRRSAQGDIPKGPFGALWDVTITDITSISRALNAMMVYSTFVADSVSQEQWDKFHDSMTRQPSEASDLQEVLDQISIPKWMKVDRSVALTSFEEFCVIHNLSNKVVNDQVDSFVETDTGMALWEEFPQYKQSIKSEIANTIDTRIGFDDYFGYHPPLNAATTYDPVGKLGCTQEPGYKLRVFASPNIVHQVAMSRLKAQLFRLLATAKWDCTYDQASGTAWAKEQLNQGKELFSIDLSDATNNFPLDVQLKVLRSLGCLEVDVKLFHRLSRAPWGAFFREGWIGRWSVGQPLGLGPSFAAFALSHGILVNSLIQDGQSKDAFRILGDDIVIAGEQLASSYLQAMSKLGVPISRDKTIRSTRFAEFAGKLVTRDGILASLKWRCPSDRSFLDVVRLLGPRSFLLLTPRQRRVATFVSVLPEPLGFGWNQYGIPFEKRLALMQACDELTDEVYRTFYPIQRTWNRMRMNLKQSYLRTRFTPTFVGDPDPGVAKASEYSSRSPRPVDGIEHQLSISEMTGCPVRLLQSQLTPDILRKLKLVGFATASSSSDPRGLNPLESWERKLVKLQPVLFQLDLNGLVS